MPELVYVQPDHLGTPRVVIDPARDVAIWEWSSKSEVFGNQAPSNDPDGDGVAFELALRFPGQQATDASGMFYNYQREYGPAVGRYSQSDPIGLVGGINTYSYVEGNPLGAVDPLGWQAYSGQTPPSRIPGGPWSPAPGQAPGTFMGPANGASRQVCRYVPDAKNGGPASATNGGYWKEKFPTEKGWRRYSLKGAPLTAQMAHPGPSRTPDWLRLAGVTSGGGLSSFCRATQRLLGKASNKQLILGTKMKSPTKEGNVISLDESMPTCLLYFEDAVRSMAKPAEELFADFDGHPGVAWELRQEILAGKPLVQWDQISSEVRAMINAVVMAAEEMPTDAYAEGGIGALRKPAWIELRKLASAFAHRTQ